MAKILRGKKKGQEVEIHQFCNDWFYLEDGSIISPNSVQLNQQEMYRVRTDPSVGILWDLFKLKDDGKFKRIKRHLFKGIHERDQFNDNKTTPKNNQQK